MAERRQFPPEVQKSMRSGHAAATCVPVKLETDAWETALFFQLAGPECKRDRRILSKANRPLAVGMEADLIENERAAVVVLRFEIHTFADDPFAAEVLLAPGYVTEQFEAIKQLTTQPRLCWFFGDQDFNLLHSQQHPLDTSQHASFQGILDDALKHDRMVRLTGRYDAQAAFAEVVSHYELRAGAVRSEYRALDRAGGPGTEN